MRIEKHGKLYVAYISFSQRQIFRNAQWWWEPKLKKWVTEDIIKVLPYREFAVGEARVALEIYDQGIGKAIRESMATDSDMYIPHGSPDRELFPYKRLALNMPASVMMS